MSLDRVIIIVLASLVWGCIDSAPDAANNQNSNDSDTGLEDSGKTGDSGVDLDDVGMEPDVGPDMAEVETIDATAEIKRLDGLFTFEGSLADVAGSMEFYGVSVSYLLEAPIPQGNSAINLESVFIAETNNSMPSLNNTLIVGSWVRDRTEGDSSAWISQSESDGSDGWSIGRLNTKLGCTLRGVAEAAFVGVEVDNFNSWNHVVCHFELKNNTTSMRALVNGISSEKVEFPNRSTSQLVRVGSWLGNSKFDGDVDELFITTQAGLAIENQRKIWACGSNGLKCRCLMSSPAEYDDCGEAPDCAALSACAESD